MCPHSELESAAVVAEAPEYSAEERALLLNLAHRSIEAALAGRELDLMPPNPHLAEPRGAFTTLHLHGRTARLYRVCGGRSLALPYCGRNSAGSRLRRPALCACDRPEAPDLKIEISVLSPLQPIRPEEVMVGKHGLVVSSGSRRGLLLPQVPVEWNWDRETFLAQTCLKAGLPPDAWQKGAELQAFTAEVFGEDG